MKPGYQTTEFWTTIIAQVLTLFTVAGILTPNDSKTLEEAATKAIVALGTLIASGVVVVQYVKSRFALKVFQTDIAADQLDQAAAKAKTPAVLPTILLLGLGLCLWSPAQAQASTLPWRNQIEQRLRDQNQLIMKLMGQPQQQPIIIQAPPPYQLLPIQGDPKQLLPIQGDPKQQLPIPGDPKQPLPIQGDPRQQLPIGGDPRQQLPIGDPRQPPVGYSIRAIGHPIE